jgi:ABC-type dipeptide/oligopeptide/nickel transport system ATPase component
VLRADRRVTVPPRPVVAPSAARSHAALGCRYAPRCEHRFEPCEHVRPALLRVGDDPEHVAMCHLYDESYARPGERAASG